MSHFIVTIADVRSGRDAFFPVDLPHVTDPTVARYVLDAELAGCQFEIVDVSAVVILPIEAAAEKNLADYVSRAGEC